MILTFTVDLVGNEVADVTEEKDKVYKVCSVNFQRHLDVLFPKLKNTHTHTLHNYFSVMEIVPVLLFRISKISRPT